jgi:hypothetical protein
MQATTAKDDGKGRKRSGLMTADEVFTSGTWIGVVALAVGVICAVAVAVSGKIRDDNLKLELANANRDAAHAYERAQQANLELAKIKSPREFRPSANFEAVGKKYLAGIKFDINANADVDSMMLAVAIRNGLLALGMNEVTSHANEKWTPPGGGQAIGVIIRPGIAIRSCDNEKAPKNKATPARILGGLLADSGLGTKDSPIFLEPADADDCRKDASVLHVEIGGKILEPWGPKDRETLTYPRFEVTMPK